MKLPGLLLLSVLLTVTVVMSGCGSSVGFGLQAEFQTIAQSAAPPFSGTSAIVVILRNGEELDTLWQQIHGGQSAPPVPRVEFQEKMVIALLDSVRPTGGYSVDITSVQPTDQGVFVSGVQTAPGPNCIVTQALTQPYHLVTVSWTPGIPSLTLISATRNCE